jgi:UDP-GlcNAc:undecaprenyl-phosphate GlcNAc-1-phosphate transferase
MDTLYVMLRRLCTRNSPFAADRGHIHHTLLDMGLGEGRVVLVVFGLTTLCGAVGVFGWYGQVSEPVLGYGLLLTFGAYCLFMQRWRQIFLALGIEPGGAPAGSGRLQPRSQRR